MAIQIPWKCYMFGQKTYSIIKEWYKKWSLRGVQIIWTIKSGGGYKILGPLRGGFKILDD